MVITRSDHPLAAKKMLRLSDCVDYPAALPDRTLSGRQILDEVTTRRDLRLNMLAESNSFEMLRGLVFRCNMISFQIEIGAPTGNLEWGWSAARSIPAMCPPPIWCCATLRGRTLPVAAATFAEILMKSLSEMRAGT